MNKQKSFFDSFANKITQATGSSWAFIVAFGSIVLWLISGPFFNFSDTWQLVINTGTGIITFLMVFLIQKSQNKDSKSIQIKLNELIASSDKASNRIIDIEDLTEKELDHLHKFYEKLAEKSRNEKDICQSHSIENAVNNQDQSHPVNKGN